MKMYLPKDLMEADMNKLHFINWDRFVFNEETKKVDLFGWIKREDTHEDFVLLEYKQHKDGKWTTSFSTSSSERTEEIFKLLYCKGEHKDCQRVESEFRVGNCIRLK